MKTKTQIQTKRRALCLLLALAVFIYIPGVRASAATTLQTGKTVSGKLTESKPEQSYAVNVSQTGYIKLICFQTGFDDDVTGVVRVYDGNDKLVNVSRLGHSKKTKVIDYIAVKKGSYTVIIDYEDYIAQVQSEYEEGEGNGTVEDAKYRIKYTFRPMAEGKKAISRSSAPLLKIGNEVSGLVLSSKNGIAAAYKYTVTKETKVDFHYHLRGDVTLQITDSEGKSLLCDGDDDEPMYYDEDEYTYWAGGNEDDSVVLEKGTYYFVITQETGFYLPFYTDGASESYKGTGFYKLKLE